MKRFRYCRFLGRGVGIFLAIVLIFFETTAQSIIVSSSGSFSNNGTIKVKGNISTSGATAATVTIGGTVELNGTSQNLGANGKTLSLNKLKVLGTDTKTLLGNMSLADSLVINNGSGKFLDIDTRSLTLSGVSILTSGSIDVSDATSTVIYNRNSGTQTVLGLTYVGNVTLSGNATKSLSASTNIAGTFSHSGGDLTVNQNLTISSATPSFATIADVTGNRTLTLSGTGVKTIAAITAVSSGSTITNSGTSGSLTITALNGNSGTISSGAGGVTFTNAATNSGKITGGAGQITFNSSLVTSTDTILAGSGDIVFNGGVTISSGAIAGGTGADLTFSSSLANSGTLVMSGTGTIGITGNYSGSGSMNLSSGSTVWYDGGTQNIAGGTYGNLTIGGTGGKTALDNVTVSGSTLALNANLSMSTYTLTMNQASTAISGTSEITGLVRRNNSFTGGQAYAFNRANIIMKLASNASADMTLGMYPATNPSGTLGTKYVQRKYTLSSSTDVTTNNLTAQLYYTDSELQGSPNENKLAFYKYSGGSWSKLSTNAGTYTRLNSTASDTITLTAINEGLSGIAEIGLRVPEYITIASGLWNATATWGSTVDDIPSTTDDAVLRHSVTGLGGANRTVASLTIQDDATYNGQLTVDANIFTADTVSNTGTLNVSAGATLALNNGLSNSIVAGGASVVTITGTANISGLVMNAGTFTVDGASGVVNATEGFNNSGSLAVNNAGGQLTISGGDFENSGTITNDGTITVE